MSNADVPKLPGAAQSPPSGPSGKGSGNNSGNTTLLIVAVLLGILAVVLNIVLVNSIREVKEEGTFTVYELTRSVEAGDRVSAKRDVREVQKPISLEVNYQDAIRSQTELINWLTDSRVQTDLPDGAILKPEYFGAIGGQQNYVPPGSRAVGVEVDNRAMPSDLKAGDEIDLYAPFPRDGTILVIERVKVRDINRGRTAITIQVKREQAPVILAVMKALEREPLLVAKRNPQDNRLIYTDEKYLQMNPRIFDIPGIRPTGN